MLPLNTIVNIYKSADRKEIHEWAKSNKMYSQSFYDPGYEFEYYYSFEKCDSCYRWFSSVSNDNTDNNSCSTCGFHKSYCNHCYEDNGYVTSVFEDYLNHVKLPYGIKIFPCHNVIVVSNKKIKNRGGRYYKYYKKL